MFVCEAVTQRMEVCVNVAEEYWDLRQPSQAQVHSLVKMLGYVLDEMISQKADIQRMIKALTEGPPGELHPFRRGPPA